MTTAAKTRRPRTTFAGIEFALSASGRVPKGAILKVLRSGRVRVECTGRYTDDYARDNADNFGKGGLSDGAILALADDIARDASGWWSFRNVAGHLDLGCHSFLGYDIFEQANDVAPDPHAEEVAKIEAWIG